MTTRVVNIRTEECDVYIGRACRRGGHSLDKSPFANPFAIERDTPAARAESLAKYENWLRAKLVVTPGLREELLALRGKRLGCWCAPKPCHGDVLVRVIEELHAGAAAGGRG